MSDTDDAVAVNEGDGAQVDELDALLSDFDKPAETGQEQKVTADDLKEVVSLVRGAASPG